MASSPNSRNFNHENCSVGVTFYPMRNDQSSSPNKGGGTLTATARKMLRSHLLYASSIKDKFINLDDGLMTTNSKARDPKVEVVDQKDGSRDDAGGRICSVPGTRNGYTCKTCKNVFATPQKFAAHANTHYKHETKAERMRRQMANKISRRRRNLVLKKVNGNLTLVPISSDFHDVAAVGAGAETQKIGSNVVSVKIEEAGGGCPLYRQDLDAPPGFEGVRSIKSVGASNMII